MGTVWVTTACALGLRQYGQHTFAQIHGDQRVVLRFVFATALVVADGLR